MSLRWRGAPPTPPPRDPAGINSIVQQHRSASSNNVRSSSRASSLFDPEEDMSSDSSSPPRPDPHHSKRRSSYENVEDHCPNKPPPGTLPGPRRSTPSPRPHHNVRSSPCPSLHSRHASPAGPRSQSVDHWSEATLSDEGESVRRRPASACRAPRTHRGSMPPVECLGSAWMHRGNCSPCCGPTPMPYHWCGPPPQNWPHYQTHPANDSIYESDDLQQRICQLEIEKEQLTLQVTVLSEQVEAQNEKITELENSLLQKKDQLNSSEALLRQEMSSRTAVENSRLDIMTQISALRLRLTSVENEKHETEEKNYKLENELILACASLAEKEADLTFLQNTYRNKIQGTANDINNSESDYLDKLKEALKSVISANDEKERQIQELKLSLSRYKKLQELVFSNRKADGLHKKFSSIDDNFHSSSDVMTPFSLEGIDELGFDFSLTDKPPPVPRQMQHSLTTIPLTEDFHRSSSKLGEIARLSPFSPIRGESPSPFSSHRYSSSENVSPPTPQKTPPAKRHYSTLPRPHATDIVQHYIKTPIESPASAMHSGQTSQSFHNLHHPNYEAFKPVSTKASSGVSFGKGFFKLRLGKRSCSAPELVPDRCPEIPETSRTIDSNYRRTSSPLTTLPPKEKSRGFKKIFGKVKRTGSENLHQSEAELKRGGIRATAGPRLGWTSPIQNGNFKADKPFTEWDSSMICDWLFYLGLGMYVQECRKWVKNGDQLLKASTHDFEKEIGIKNPLHRKKLLLAVSGAKEQAGDTVEPAGKLDHQWVVRWLDDIGLPQYKDAFFDARVDGRVLYHLTLEDLSYLKVTNLLHHISIKTGIQVLRENYFDGHCLKRRSLPDDENSPTDVSKWTNHRVMEWLRTVDLSEYAPNLRGSGVHGGLMLYEQRFNADLMATLLNIPPSKTLLRRHLSTQFKLLVGADIMQKKREWESQPSYSPLSPSAKVKAVKKSHFSLMKRKNKNELAFEDYVCPLTFSDNVFSTTLTNGHNTSEEEKFLMKEMVIKNEKILDSMPASNV